MALSDIDARFLKQKSDDELWKLVETSLKDLRRVAKRMSQLTAKDKNNNLSDTEYIELEVAIEHYDIYTLLRTQVLVELQERGYDIQAYLKANAPK